MALYDNISNNSKVFARARVVLVLSLDPSGFASLVRKILIGVSFCAPRLNLNHETPETGLVRQHLRSFLLFARPTLSSLPYHDEKGARPVKTPP